MIVAQERAFLKAQQLFQALEAFVEQAAQQEQRIDRVERDLFSRLLNLGHALLSAFVAAQRRRVRLQAHRIGEVQVLAQVWSESVSRR